MKRLFDITASCVLLLFAAIPLAVVAAVVKLTSKGPVLYWSDRVGRDNRLFRMPKFRTMRTDTPELASHLLDGPQRWLTPIGGFLRRSSLDEFPQLWCILKGEMSFVGPRPALHSQHDLIAMRTAQGVHELPVGLTGWAQINGRDESPLSEKVSHDACYRRHQSFLFDLKILFLTAWKVVRQDGTAVPTEVADRDRGFDSPADSTQNSNRRAA